MSAVIRQAARERRADAILSRLNSGPVIGAEIGVFHGRLSELLLMRKDLTLHMVDSWLPSHKQPISYRNSGDKVATLSASKMAIAKGNAMALTAFAASRRQVFESESTHVARTRPDFFYDFVFIDANHSYIGCAQDLVAWYRKVKPGGLLCGHDYEHPNFPGVKQAVDEFCAAHSLTIELGDDNTWFARLP